MVETSLGCAPGLGKICPTALYGSMRSFNHLGLGKGFVSACKLDHSFFLVITEAFPGPFVSFPIYA